MCNLVKNNQIKVSTSLNSYQYTYQVLKELENEYTADSLFLIIGADNIINFDKWKNIDDLLEYNIIVVNRDNININKYVECFNKKDNFIVINNFDYIPISSTYLRNNINSDVAKEYIDERVYRYIKEKRLYWNRTIRRIIKWKY